MITRGLSSVQRQALPGLFRIFFIVGVIAEHHTLEKMVTHRVDFS